MLNYLSCDFDEITYNFNHKMTLEEQYHILKTRTNLVDNIQLEDVAKIVLWWSSLYIYLKNDKEIEYSGLAVTEIILMEERYNLLKEKTDLVDNIPFDSIKQIQFVEYAEEDYAENYILLKDGTLIGDGDKYGDTVKYINMEDMYDARIIITKDNRFVIMGDPNGNEQYLHDDFCSYEKIILTDHAIVCLGRGGTIKVLMNDIPLTSINRNVAIDYGKHIDIYDIGIIDNGGEYSIIIKKNKKIYYLFYNMGEIPKECYDRCIFDKTDMSNPREIHPYIIF